MEKRSGRSRRSSDLKLAREFDAIQARLDHVLESLDTGVAIADESGRIVQSNGALSAMLGFSEEELRGTPFQQFTHPDDVQATAKLSDEMRLGKRDQYHMEKRYIRKNGEVFWGALTAARIDGPAGSPRLTVGMVDDITLQRQAEDEQRTEGRFRAVLTRLSTIANSTLDLDEMLPMICEAATEAFELRAMSIFLFDGPARLLVAASTLQAVQVGTSCPLSVEALATVRCARSRRPVYNNEIPPGIPDEIRACMESADMRSVLAAPIVIRDEIQGVLTLVSDEPGHFSDSDLHRGLELGEVLGAALRNGRLYRQEQELAERFRLLERQRTAFLRVMAHELRTPLGHITGFSDLVGAESAQLSERGQRYLEHVRAAASTLDRLMRRSLDMVALYDVEREADREDVSVTGLLADVLTNYQRQITEKQLKVRHVVPTEHVATRGQPRRLHQMMDILVDNAVKFSPREGQIEIGIARTGDTVTVKVWNDGPPVPSDLAEYIFSGQAEDAMTRHHGGAGLSLLVARRIAELHGGELVLEPSEHGNCFRLTLVADS